jgi:hypothetical protein
MGRKPLQKIDFSTHSDPLPENPDVFLPADNRPAGCPLRLVAGKYYAGLRFPEIVFQMMLNPAGISHTAGRNYDLW